MNEKYIGYDKGTSDETIITMKLKDYQALERKLKVAVKALEFCALGENQFTDGIEQMHKARQALAEIKGE